MILISNTIHIDNDDNNDKHDINDINDMFACVYTHTSYTHMIRHMIMYSSSLSLSRYIYIYINKCT